MLYRSVTDRWPWPVDDRAQILAAHLNGVPEPLPSLDGLPGEVNDLYLSCLAKDPRQRPTAREAAATLAAAAGTPSARLGATHGETAAAVAGPSVAPAPETHSATRARDVTTLLPGPVEPASQRVPPTRSAPVALAGWGPAPGRRPLSRRAIAARRTAVGVAAVAVAGVVGGLIVTTTADHDPARLAAAAGGNPSCTVTYRVGTDDGATFTGMLTLDAGGAAPAGGWSVAFDLPNSQTFRAAAAGTSAQHGGHVQMHLAGDGTGPVSVPFTGEYRGTNPMPAAFTADGRSCSPVLIGPSGRAQTIPAAAPSSPSDIGSGAQPVARAGGADEGQGQRQGQGQGQGITRR